MVAASVLTGAKPLQFRQPFHTVNPPYLVAMWTREYCRRRAELADLSRASARALLEGDSEVNRFDMILISAEPSTEDFSDCLDCDPLQCKWDDFAVLWACLWSAFPFLLGAAFSFRPSFLRRDQG
jgi:hypothetical protein